MKSSSSSTPDCLANLLRAAGELTFALGTANLGGHYARLAMALDSAAEKVKTELLAPESENTATDLTHRLAEELRIVLNAQSTKYAIGDSHPLVKEARALSSTGMRRSEPDCALADRIEKEIKQLQALTEDRGDPEYWMLQTFLTHADRICAALRAPSSATGTSMADDEAHQRRVDVIEECARELEAEANSCLPGSAADDQNWGFAIQSCATKLRKLKRDVRSPDSTANKEKP